MNFILKLMNVQSFFHIESKHDDVIKCCWFKSENLPRDFYCVVIITQMWIMDELHVPENPTCVFGRDQKQNPGSVRAETRPDPELHVLFVSSSFHLFFFCFWTKRRELRFFFTCFNHRRVLKTSFNRIINGTGRRENICEHLSPCFSTLVYIKFYFGSRFKKTEENCNFLVSSFLILFFIIWQKRTGFNFPAGNKREEAKLHLNKL